MIARRHETVVHAASGQMALPVEPVSLYRGWYIRNGMAHYDGDLTAFVNSSELQIQYKQQLELQEKIKIKQREQGELSSMLCSREDRQGQLLKMWEADNQDYIKALSYAMDKGAFRFDRLSLSLRERIPPLPRELVKMAIEALPKRENAISEKARASKNAKLEAELSSLRSELEGLYDPRWTVDTVGGVDARKLFIGHWRETQKALNRPADWLCFDLEARSKAIRSCWKAFVGEQYINVGGKRPYHPGL